MNLLNSPDALVVGAGLAGLATAHALATRGARVTVLEQDIAGRHASTLNAGGVRRTNRHPAELKLTTRAFQLWPTLADRLGADVGYRVTGHLLVAEDEDELMRLSARAAHVAALGFTHEQVVDRAEVRALVPTIAPHILGGLWGADDGHADPRATVTAFRDAVERAGAHILESTALLALFRAGGTWRAETSAGTIGAAVLVNCAGAWGGQVASMAGDPLPVQPSAPMALMLAPQPHFVRPVVQTLTRRLSLKQLDDGRVMIGGGHRARMEQLGSPSAVAAEAEANLATARSIFPQALVSALPARIWAGTEGYAPDGIAIVGRSERVDGLVHGFCFSGHGFAPAPAVGEVLAELAQGIAPSVDISGLAPGRFQRPPTAALPTHDARAG